MCETITKYSTNDEEYRYDELYEVFDDLASGDGFEIDMEYYSAEFTPLESRHVIFADNIIEDIDGRVYDCIGGDDYNGFSDNVSKEAQDELQELLNNWCEKYDLLNGFSIYVGGSSKTHYVTEEDIKEYASE